MYVKNSTITGITDGLYIAVNAISANTPFTAADLDNTDTAEGGLNASNSKLTKIQTDTITISSGVASSWSLDASSIYLISVAATNEPLAMFIPFIENGIWKLRCYNNTTMQPISTYNAMSLKYAYVDG